MRLGTISESLSASTVNESYGEVLTELESAFRKAEGLMKGSSVSPQEIWIDVGVRLGYITENEGDKIKHGE